MRSVYVRMYVCMLEYTAVHVLLLVVADNDYLAVLDSFGCLLAIARPLPGNVQTTAKNSSISLSQQYGTD